MKEKTKIIFALSCFSVLTVGAVVTGTSNSSTFGLVFANSSNVWKHYKQALPGTVDGTANGVREYWVECGGSYQFTAPTGVTIEEGTNYDVSEFKTNDPRWIIPLEGQKVLMTAATKSLNLGNYTGMTITSITDGKHELGADASNLDVSGFAADHSEDGEKTVLVQGDTCWLQIPVTFVTKEIADAAEWATIVPKVSNTTIYGYYELTANILPSLPEWISGWDTAIFSGTVDGNGYTITAGQNNYGLFYFIKNATFKNFSMYNNGWKRTTVNQVHFAQKMNNCKFENINFLKPALATGQDGDLETLANNYGYLNGNAGAQVVSFKDCTWDFGNWNLPCLISHSTNSTKTITFENCVLYAGSVTELYNSNTGVVKAADGLKILTRGEDTLDRVELLASADQASITLPEKYKGATIKTAKFTHGGDQYPIADIASFEIPAAVKTDTQKHGTDNAVVITLQTDSQEVIVTVPVTVVTSVITTNDQLSALTHVSGTKTTVNGYYKLGNNLNLNDDKTYTDFKSGSVMYNTFSGTFDGAGHTIISKSRPYGIFGELFGATIKNVKITDAWCYGGIDMTTSVLSIDMTNTTLDSVNVTMTAKADRDSQFASLVSSFDLTKQNYGWINSRVCHTCTFKNCNFDGGTTLKVITLIGTHPSCVYTSFTNSTFKCNEYYCIYQSSHTSTVTTIFDGLSITGTCVYSA